MGICHEPEQSIGENPSLNPIRPEHETPEDQLDRTLHAADEQQVSEKREKGLAGEEILADPRGKILELYDEFRPRLFRYIRSLHLRREQAEEVIQETFMRLTTELLHGTRIDNVQGWIVRVAHNIAVDSIKKNERDMALTSEVTLFDLHNRPDPATGPETAYLNKEQSERMEIALSTLKPQQRQCFHMRVQGFRYKDIGLALGISEQRVAIVVKQAAVRLAAICG